MREGRPAISCIRIPGNCWKRLLHMLAEEGEDATMDYIRREVLRNRRRKRARR